jgi:hypothetical protein
MLPCSSITWLSCVTAQPAGSSHNEQAKSWHQQQHNHKPHLNTALQQHDVALLRCHTGTKTATATTASAGGLKQKSKPHLNAALQQHDVALLRHRTPRRQHQQLTLDQLLLQVQLQRCQVLPHPCRALLPAHALLVPQVTGPVRTMQQGDTRTAGEFKSALLLCPYVRTKQLCERARCCLLMRCLWRD